jgi:5-methyltetrahydrofolate--homocysteine methyltransferase
VAPFIEIGMIKGRRMKFTDTLLKQRLAAGELLVADGAAGTMLIAAGLPHGTPPDLWNLDNPQAILQLHRAYVDAGSQIILTNTFGGSRLKLEKHNLGERTHAINLAGAQLARQASGSRAYVAGDIGPTGELMEPFGALNFERAVEVFSEQAAALVEGGVDALWIETMMDLEEARAAVTAARQASDLPVFCTLSFGPKGRTMMGVRASQAVETLWPLGLAAIGANCGEGLGPVEIALAQMHEALPEAPLIAKPNAGLPKTVAGETVYDVGPVEFAGRIKDFVALGARIVGACCGSNPEYISAIAASLPSDGR